MSEAEFDKLMDHEYDGIREYDNPLPGWWTGLFIVCILFALGYWLYYHWGGPGLSVEAAYQQEMDEWSERQAKLAEKTGKVEEGMLASLATNDGALAEGRKIFVKNCVACHDQQGQGKIGPNLTDLHQIHGNTRVDIYNTIQLGVPAKGMISWQKVLRQSEMMRVAAYVSTLRGKKVKGRPPEGEQVEAFD